jgi:hypothetical protein
MSRNAFAECERDYNEAAATKEEHQACVEEDALQFYNLGYTAAQVRKLMPCDTAWDAQYANKVCAAFARLSK